MAVIFAGSSIPNADFSDNLETERLIHLVAHLAEYSILGLLLARSFLGNFQSKHRGVWVLSATAVSFVYALTDEYHQYFVIGRLFSWKDIGNDVLGGSLGAFFWWGVTTVFERRGRFFGNTIVSSSEQETERVGCRLAKRLRGGEVLALMGELGSGKTAFVRGLFSGLGCQGRVLSPTFVLMRVYKGGRLDLIHVDLYRLDSLSDVKNLGLEEHIKDKGSVVVIEWAERAQGLLPDSTIKINFRYLDDSRRAIAIES